MSRALLVVLDSVGIGGAPDAARYGDEGADTVGHIAEACAAGHGDRAGLRAGPLRLPNLVALGLGRACEIATGRVPPGLAPPKRPIGSFGAAREIAGGKDTISGHWEIAGMPLVSGFGYFPDARPAFPPSLTEALIREAGLPGILGDRHAPGTAILDDLGAEHLRTGKPICYTSVDSVFQIAAHEEAFGLERLYETCRIARRLCDPLRIGRVIARPFLGSAEAGFVRTPRRRDFAMPPPGTTLLDRLCEAARAVVTIGKIGDILAHRGTGREIKTADNAAGIEAILAAMAGLADGGLAFANLVDFDTEYGHRRDVPGYAAALEAFDRRLPEITRLLRPGDLAIVTADHGNDPTFRGTDHTREQVPILAFGPGIPARPLGARETYADIGATLAEHLGVAPLEAGRSFLGEMAAGRKA
ncbi:phosphopentomutase [Enterovirga rhinocerotis]|uniref:Phosphopentomutase n=1 Tax=Enterovirga rhinocerotis TaxID=1339210 RepID=A0A4V3DXU3_9HYPH|nr:phosphopentomutase [Enterovirga rhinocerotis]TDR89819.1 phosphopentomutase [Enterovirga rhinocerotis]